MRTYYMNKVNKEIVIYTHTDPMDGEVYFRDLEDNTEMSCSSHYWRDNYMNLTRAVEKLEQVIANHGDYTTPNLPELYVDDMKKILILIKTMIK